MKAKQMAWMLLLAWLWTASTFAQSSTSSTVPGTPSGGSEIVTRTGGTYKNARIQKVAPDGLVIIYSPANGGIGISKIKFEDLPDDLRQRYGYNPTNAAAFEMQQKQAESQWQAKWKADDEKAQSKHHEQEIADAEADIEARGGEVGSGFFITDNGYLLTCLHVVNHAANGIQVGTKRGLFNAVLVQSDPDKDVALLKVAGTFSSLPLISSNSVNFGEAVFTIGFPDPKFQGWQPKLTRGEISSLSGFQDDTNEYQISVPVQPGNSGGALVDEHGNVIGIVSGKLNALAALAASGQLSENVNYAIKSSCAKTLLDSVPGGPLRLKSEYPSADRKFEDVVQASQDAVVLVMVQ